MFFGTYEINLLDKHRIGLPSKVRQELSGERIVLTIGFEQCVAGYAESAWTRATEQELVKPISDHNARDLKRQMFSKAAVIDLDSQGRFVTPENLVKFGGFEKELVVIGAGDHFEIWDRKKWEEYSAKIGE